MARVRMIEGQMALDLFSDVRAVRDPDYWVGWLVKQHGVSGDGVALARRIFAELPWLEATERCKVVPAMSGSERIDGFTVADADLFGLFDLTLDYHVCWDRHWAAKKGVARDRIAGVVRWDYGKAAPVYGEEVQHG